MTVHHISTSEHGHCRELGTDFHYPVVLLKFKQGITPTDIEKVRMSLHGLPSRIPAISGIKAGHKIKHPLDHDFDEGWCASRYLGWRCLVHAAVGEPFVTELNI